ncbi:purine permease 21-like [Rhodamnia argentea]|uniref:Probable purine permease n=1 Tax=Rhodamnia argentea TaxID=178133 RepID=A0ABM3HXA7_9MYRT|nr:purine permease 21-like [Rhodamnia argentea]
MGEQVQETQLSVRDEESRETKSPAHMSNAGEPEAAPSPARNYKCWLKIAVFSLFVLSGQSIATILGRLYYEKGGKSKWMETLVQIAGFPILIPYLFFSPNKPSSTTKTALDSRLLALVYVVFGIIFAASTMMFSVGLQYLPVSTFSLITASQLGFNALLAFFINSQKFTPLTINSIVLLTVSSTLLVFQTDSNSTTTVSTGKYVVGFICTLIASAGCALILNLTQLYFRKVQRKDPIYMIFELLTYESMVATFIVLVGLFASGEWKGLREEMEEFSLGKVSYVMTLVWTAITWQVFAIGMGGLIFQVSSVFSNVIAVVGLPIVPVLAVVFLDDKMDGVKGIAMALAIWGFLSYVYQQHLDDVASKAQDKSDKQSGQIQNGRC